MHHHLAASGNLGQVLKRDYPILNGSRADDPPNQEPVALVGPLCTPLDTIGRKVRLSATRTGDVIAVRQSGAYGLSASPVGFLTHPTPAEVLIDGAEVTLIRTPGTFAEPVTQIPLGIRAPTAERPEQTVGYTQRGNRS